MNTGCLRSSLLLLSFARLSLSLSLPTSLSLSLQDGRGYFRFSSDTFANAFTLRAAQLACGSVVSITQAVVSGAADRGVAIVRPPGHHAEPDAAMGFCFYNNVRRPQTLLTVDQVMTDLTLQLAVNVL